MTVKIYGIRNCDTMKKAFSWLESQHLTFEFHDYKKAGIDAPRVEAWCAGLGWEKVLNRAGTTFRALPDEDKADLNADKAVTLMVRQPSMIKRPIIEFDGRLMAGFKPELYAQFFGK